MLQLPPPFANTPPVSRRMLSAFDDRRPGVGVEMLELGEHTGTHFDAPIHWITGRDGEDVASAPPSRLVGPARGDRQVRRGGGGPRLPAHGRRRAGVRERARAAARGRLAAAAHRLGRPRARPGGVPQRRATRPAPTPSAPAGSPRRRRWSGSGSRRSGPTRAPRGGFDPPFPAHAYLLGAGKYGVTQLANLAELPPTGALVVVAPLKLVDGTGSPARVLALVAA